MLLADYCIHADLELKSVHIALPLLSSPSHCGTLADIIQGNACVTVEGSQIGQVTIV